MFPTKSIPQGLVRSKIGLVVILVIIYFLQTTTVKSSVFQECGHTIYSVPDFYKCDRDNDHLEEFNINLTELESDLIRNQTGLVVTYHNAGGDLIDFSPGTQFVVNQRTIIARATNADACYKETSFKLTLVSPPVARIIADISECESYTLPSIDEYSDYYSGINGSGRRLLEGQVLTSSQTVYVYAVNADCSDESSFDITIDPTICQENIEEINFIFPKFFTPNGDNINDLWKYEPYPENRGIKMELIEIYDRYGNFLKYLDQVNLVWDGMVDGKLQPSSDYWFKAKLEDGSVHIGHFALKR